jgi:hypothetical protein
LSPFPHFCRRTNYRESRESNWKAQPSDACPRFGQYSEVTGE